MVCQEFNRLIVRTETNQAPARLTPHLGLPPTILCRFSRVSPEGEQRLVSERNGGDAYAFEIGREDFGPAALERMPTELIGFQPAISDRKRLGDVPKARLKQRLK